MNNDRQDLQNAINKIYPAINQLQRQLDILREQLSHRNYSPDDMRTIARVLKRIAQEIADFPK